MSPNHHGAERMQMTRSLSDKNSVSATRFLIFTFLFYYCHDFADQIKSDYFDIILSLCAPECISNNQNYEELQRKIKTLNLTIKQSLLLIIKNYSKTIYLNSDFHLLKKFVICLIERYLKLTKNVFLLRLKIHFRSPDM